MTQDPRIPADFEIGVATSAWQIEGDVDGRGRSIWDDFAQQPGAIRDGSTGEPACDHVHRLEEDLDLISWIGPDAYRFSISWPRVQPEGRGALSARGLDFYDRLIDGLLARGIRPSATLYHWDLPSALPGAWLNRDTALAFADYAEKVAARFSDRVARWATLNEPWVSAFLGYSAGVHAPGHRDAGSALLAAHHLLLAHGMAVPRMRGVGARNVGIVLNLQPVVADAPQVEAAADYVDALHNRLFLNLLAGRGWSELRQLCAPLSDFAFDHPGDEDVIAAPIDWLGENYYTPVRIGPKGPNSAFAVGQNFDAYPGTPPAAFAPREPVTAMGWEVYPQGLIDIARKAASLLPDVPIWIAENGAAFDDEVVRREDGTLSVPDSPRVEYLRSHLTAVLEARSQGVDIRGYYAWSLLDNIEWAEGWTKRFGIVRVSPDDQTRIPKNSAHWLRSVLARRRDQSI